MALLRRRQGVHPIFALDQINRDNVKQLQVVWRRPAVDDKLKQAFPDLSVGSYLRSTPIFIDGMLYTQDAHGFVSAFDPAPARRSGSRSRSRAPRRRSPARARAASTTGAAAAISGSSSSAASISTR